MAFETTMTQTIAHQSAWKMHLSAEKDPEFINALEQLWAAKDNRSLLKRVLSPDLFELLKSRTIYDGQILWNCIKSGVENPDSKIGIYAADRRSYKQFAPLFNPVIEAYHGLRLDELVNSSMNPTTNVEIPAFSVLAKTKVKSVRIRACRSLSDYPFHPNLTKTDYEKIESQVFQALSDLPANLKGTYHTVAALGQKDLDELQREKILFPPPSSDKYLRSASGAQYYPIGRGAFVNNAEEFIIWVNEEDHLRFMSIRADADLKQAFEVLHKYLRYLGKRLPFSHDERLGYLMFCPTNIGCTVRASIHIHLPKLGQNIQRLKSLASTHKLQIRGVGGENSAVGGEIFDLSNQRRLGISSLEAVEEMLRGVEAIAQIEDRL